jgi:methionyl aminopeptidase
MSITRPEQFEKLKECGRIVAKALRAMAAAVCPGVTTAELAAIGSKELAEHGARSSPPMVYGFPGDVCISVNDEVVHGIPDGRVLQPGDLVKLDLTAEKDGYHTDSAMTVPVPPVSNTASNLARCTERAFRQSLAAARAGNSVREIGRAVEREVRRRGFHVIRELGGHGIGRTIHEPPSVPNFADASNHARLTEGLVLTIEPIIAAGTRQVSLDADKWTLRTVDGSLAAHYEHTLVITRGEPIVLTCV